MKSSSLAVIIKGSNFSDCNDALNNKANCLALLLRQANCKVVLTGIDTAITTEYVPRRVRRCIYIPLKAKLFNLTTLKPISVVFAKIYNAIWISLFLYSYCAKHNVSNVFILYDDFQISIVILKILTLRVHCKFICCLDEWGPASASNKFLYMKQKIIVFILLNLADSCFTISSYIYNKILKIKPSLPCLQLPAISNLSRWLPSNTKYKSNIFIVGYAANIAYQDQLDIVLRGFLEFKNNNFSLSSNNSFKLNIVLSGNQSLIKEFKNLLSAAYAYSDISIYSNLTDQCFSSLLYNSSVLLCPLSNDIINIARFPQKLADYAALHGLIVVSPVGDVKTYFQHMNNAIYLQNFDFASVAQSLQKAFSMDVSQRLLLKHNARVVYDSYFSIPSNVLRLKSFLHKMI